jgi:hypothetical protein
MILTTATTALGEASTKDEPRSLDEYLKIMDVQIPGWQQQGKPVVTPIVRNNETFAVTINSIFRSKGQIIKMKLIIPEKETVPTIMSRISKEHARQLQVGGFDAINDAPPINPFEEYKNSLYINVADRYVLLLEGTEVLDGQTLVTAAEALGLKKLATLPK